MNIREGMPDDSLFIAGVVTGALGNDLCVELAGSEQRLPLVTELFARLAADPDSQYSYKNTLIAPNDRGMSTGGIIAYDGAELHRLRKAFIREANGILGWNVTEKEAEDWGDEAQSDEIYIDSLYVVPEYRKRGVASALLKGIERRFAVSNKPIGLLVEPENARALEAYTHWGFTRVGISHFFRTPMIHMQKAKG